MCSSLKTYTWTLFVGHEMPAIISVVASNPDTARFDILSHVLGLESKLEAIKDCPADREAILRKLRLTAAAAIGISMDDFCHQISSEDITFSLNNLLKMVKPTVDPVADPSKKALGNVPIFHHVTFQC
jgi:hypothetical protein